MVRNLLASLLVVGLLASTAVAQSNSYGSEDLDRPLSTWGAGANEAPDALFDPTDPNSETKPNKDFLGEPIAGNNFVFVLDKSCSMGASMSFQPVYNSGGNIISNPNRWQVVQSETANIISQMTEDDTFDIVLYESSYTVWTSSLQVANDANKSAAISYIFSWTARGGTMYYQPLNYAFSHSGYENADTIVFMTDGYPADANAVQNAFPNWVNNKSDNFAFMGFQIGGGSLNSVMAFFNSFDKCTVVLK